MFPEALSAYSLPTFTLQKIPSFCFFQHNFINTYFSLLQNTTGLPQNNTPSPPPLVLNQTPKAQMQAVSLLLNGCFRTTIVPLRWGRPRAGEKKWGDRQTHIHMNTHTDLYINKSSPIHFQGKSLRTSCGPEGLECQFSYRISWALWWKAYCSCYLWATGQ